MISFGQFGQLKKKLDFKGDMSLLNPLRGQKRKKSIVFNQKCICILFKKRTGGLSPPTNMGFVTLKKIRFFTPS